MKFYLLSFLIIFAIFHSACKKKENAAVVGLPVNSASKDDSIYKTISAVSIAKYMGAIQATIYYGGICGPSPESYSNDSFVYKVTDNGNGSLTFAMEYPINFVLDQLSIGGTFKKNAMNIYSNDTISNITFKIVGNNLYVSGTYGPNGFDDVNGSVTYAGSLLPSFDTAVVQAQHR